MKIFRSDQIREIDAYTIKNEPVASSDLMERAASKLCEWFTQRFQRSRHILIFAGPGNNGGDGLTMARLLAKDRYEPEVYYVHFTDNVSGDWKTTRKKLEKETGVPFHVIEKADQFPLTSSDDIIIDAIFGSGLTRPASGLAAEIIRQINQTDLTVISIDMPSGLFGEDNSGNDPDCIIRADYTLSFQFPRLAFMFRDNQVYTGLWTILPIGLHPRAIAGTKTQYELLEMSSIAPLIRKRNKFDHKGDFGHGLLIGGSFGKMGAIILGARAALRTGAGLISCHVPDCGNLPLQIAIPEAMVIHDRSERYISDISSPDYIDAYGIGPGMGTMKESGEAFCNFLLKCRKPLVIDADALNILSMNREWLSILPERSVLTPHPKEFERLAGKTDTGYDRLMKQIEFSQKYNCIVVLKGAHTSVTSPDGDVFFNSTGNPGMATAGSGDVLTGMILSLLAQGYDPFDAALTGVFIHGLAGDIASDKSCCEAVIASDIINAIPDAFRRLKEEIDNN